MNKVIENLFKALELDQEIWLELENSQDYQGAHEQLEELNQEIKKILMNELGKEGRSLLQNQEDLYYKLMDCSQRYFFEKGMLYGIELGMDVAKFQHEEKSDEEASE